MMRLRKNKNNLTYDQVREEKKTNKLDILLEVGKVVLVFLGVITALSSLRTGLLLTVKLGYLALIVLLITGLYYLYYLFISKSEGLKNVTRILSALIYSFVFFIWTDELKSGLLTIANQYIKLINIYNETKWNYLGSITQEEALQPNDYNVFIAFLLVSVIITVIACWVVYNRKSSLLFILVTAPFAFLPLSIGLVGEPMELTTYVIVAIAVILSNGILGRGEKNRIQHIVIAQTLGALALLLFVTTFIVSSTKYYDEIPVKPIRKSIQHKIQEISKNYLFEGNTFMQWLDYKYGSTMVYGTLGDVDKVEYNKEVMLQVTQSGKPEGTLYLKGFVGETYKGDHWGQLSEENDPEYNDESVRRKVNIPDAEGEWVNLVDLTYRESGYLEEMVVDYEPDSLVVSDLEIKKVGIGKDNEVVPYYAIKANINEDIYVNPDQRTDYKEGVTDYVSLASASQVGALTYNMQEDGLVNLEDVGQSYHLLYCAKLLPVIKSIVENTDFEYQNKNSERLYNYLQDNVDAGLLLRKYYVYGKYNNEPESIAFMYERLDADIRHRTDSDAFNGGQYVAFAIKAVKEYLSSTTKYSLAPGKLPKDKEFVDYFLNEQKIGYCQHYATAATLFFRYLGIPARYVEGFAVKKSDLSKAYNKSAKEKKEKYTVDVLDENAHAWVEIFIDSMGWIPIEVTPGSYDESASDVKEIGEGDVTKKPEDEAHPEKTVTPASMAPRPVKPSTGPNSIITHLGKELWILIVLIGVILMIFLSILIRYRWKTGLLRKRLSKATPSRRIFIIYREVEKVCVHYGKRYQGESMEEYAKKMQEAIRVGEKIEKEEYERFLGIVFKGSYGNERITEEESKMVEDFYLEFRTCLYLYSKKLRLVYLKYIKCF